MWEPVSNIQMSRTVSLYHRFWNFFKIYSKFKIVDKAFSITAFNKIHNWNGGSYVYWDPFLESPDNFSGPESYIMQAMFTLKTQILLVLKVEL